MVKNSRCRAVDRNAKTVKKTVQENGEGGRGMALHYMACRLLSEQATCGCCIAACWGWRRQQQPHRSAVFQYRQGGVEFVLAQLAIGKVLFVLHVTFVKVVSRLHRLFSLARFSIE
jgi:hypothetical protein